MLEANEKIKLLTFSSDQKMLSNNSYTFVRAIEYGELVGKSVVVVPTNKNIDPIVRKNTTVYGVFISNFSTIVGRIYALIKAFIAANRLIEKEGINVVSSQDPFEYGFVAYLLARRNNIGLHIQNHGDFFGSNFWKSENIIHSIRYYIGIFVIKRAKSVRVVSKRIKNNLINNLNIDSKIIVNVPIFNDNNRRSETGKYKPKEYKGKFVFLTIARLEKEKNISLMIDALKEVTRKTNNSHLVIAGDGSEAVYLKKKVREMHLEDKVDFVGWVDDIFYYYNLADAYLLSSNHEGWGMVMIEAMSVGLPVVTTDVGCAGEVIKNNENGIVVPVMNKDALVSAMTKISAEPDLREKLSKGATNSYNKLPFTDKNIRYREYQKSWEIALR